MQYESKFFLLRTQATLKLQALAPRLSHHFWTKYMYLKTQIWSSRSCVSQANPTNNALRQYCETVLADEPRTALCKYHATRKHREHWQPNSDQVGLLRTRFKASRSTHANTQQRTLTRLQHTEANRFESDVQSAYSFRYMSQRVSNAAKSCCADLIPVQCWMDLQRWLSTS